MPVGSLMFVLFALLAVGGPIVLYLLIDRETDHAETMDRSDAERRAKEESGRDRW